MVEGGVSGIVKREGGVGALKEDVEGREPNRLRKRRRRKRKDEDKNELAVGGHCLLMDLLMDLLMNGIVNKNTWSTIEIDLIGVTKYRGD